jgi:pyruvate dehydrogenase phosphatase
MIRRFGSPLLIVGGLGGAAYYALHGRQESKDFSNFKLAYRVRDSSGRIATATTSIPYLSEDSVDEKLGRLNAQHSTTDILAGRKWIWHTAQLGSNDPIEDSLAFSIVEGPESRGNLMFFAVMDGHGGPWTSRLLSKILIPRVALELELLNKLPTYWNFLKPTSILNQLKATVKEGTLPSNFGPREQLSSAESVSLAIRRAFENIDREILSAPLRYLKKPNEDIISDPVFAANILPARSGLISIITVSHELELF